MHIQTDRALIPARAPSVRYLHVVISAPAAPPRAPHAAARPPAAVALVLDRSGSMDGSKFAMARTAVEHAVRLLAPTDELAVVCYDDRVDTVLARTPASAEAKRLALERLARVDARGSTNLEGGWTRGAEELQPATADVRRVLLLTDGLANQGVVDPEDLAATAARLRAQGITTSTFGVGADFDEQLLARLAAEGGGHFYFIEQPRQIPDLLASELGETLDVVAREAVFEITAGGGVDLGVLNRADAELAPGVLRVRLGDLVADQEVTLVVAVGVREVPAAGESVSVRCRLSDRDQALVPLPLVVDWRVVEPAEHDAQPVNEQVLVAVARHLAGQAKAMALVANRQGHYDDAQRILHDMAATLRRLAPGNAEVARLAAGLEGERVLFQSAMSPLEMKRRHFASHVMAESREPEGKARRRHERRI
ncbi:MAG: VWA domain-containing protein [Vicinamibacterales bacterium]